MAYTFIEKDEYFHIDWHGVITQPDLDGIRREIPERAQRVGRPRNVLHTFDKVTQCDLVPLSAYEHSLKCKSIPIPKRAKSASVAKTDDIYRYAKLFQELNRNPNLEMQIFADEAEAIAWLTR